MKDRRMDSFEKAKPAIGILAVVLSSVYFRAPEQVNNFLAVLTQTKACHYVLPGNIDPNVVFIPKNEQCLKSDPRLGFLISEP